jgi:hypothetical protein
MSADNNVVVPFGLKNLGDLSKNNCEINELLFAILRAVENVGAQKCTGRKQGISHCLIHYLFYSFNVSNQLYFIISLLSLTGHR